MRPYSTCRLFFSSCHILASTCCLIKPSVNTSKTHYRALYIKGLLSLSPVCTPLHSHQSSPCLQVLPPEHKRILIPRRAILLILREMSGDVQNGNGKRKGKSKASCSSDSTDGHGPDQTWTETWSFSVLCVTWEHFPSRRKKEKHTDNSLQEHHALQSPHSVCFTGGRAATNLTGDRTKRTYLSMQLLTVLFAHFCAKLPGWQFRYPPDQHCAVPQNCSMQV